METYNPNALLDALMQKLGAKNDAALARAMELAPPVLSKIRHHRLSVGASFLVTAHELTGMSVRDLRALMGDRRERFRAAGMGEGWATRDAA
jgi:hypothetical protein